MMLSAVRRSELKSCYSFVFHRFPAHRPAKRDSTACLFIQPESSQHNIKKGVNRKCLNSCFMIEEITGHRKRIFWTDAQDAQLVQLVEVYGVHSWPEVSSHFVGRDSKACSLRWRYFLAPHIVRSTEHKLSEWEVAVLVWAQREHGNKWRNIAEDHLPWRSPNDLKNYWNQHVNGKQQQVLVQNKLLLQGLSLEALRQNPPPEVHARWQKVMATRDSPKGCQPPAKKGTRGLSYIIRQAAKSQSQRAEGTSSYSRPSGSRKRRFDSCSDDPHCQDPTYCPLQDSIKEPRLGPGAYIPNQAAAAAAAGCDDGGAYSGSGDFYSSTPRPYTSVKPSAAGTIGEPYSSMSHSSHIGSGSMQVDNTTQISSSMPLVQRQQHAVHGLLPGLDTHMGCTSGLNMAAAAAAATSQVPAAGAQGHCQPAGLPTWAPDLDCSPNGYCSSDGSAGQVPYTPGSASSCAPLLDFAALQAMQQQSINGPTSTNMQTWGSTVSPQGSKRNSNGNGMTAAAAAATAAGVAPAGAFGNQCGPVNMASLGPAQDRLASFTANSSSLSSSLYAAGGGSSSGSFSSFSSFSSGSPTGLRTSSMSDNSFTYPAAAGIPASAGWQQLLPGCASGNSISSNSSGSCGVSVQGFHSPTHTDPAAQQHTATPAAVPQQQHTNSGVLAQLPVANQQQQQQQPDRAASLPVYSAQQQQILLLLYTQQQQQQLAAAALAAGPPAPRSITATAAAAEASVAVAAEPTVDIKPTLDVKPILVGMTSATVDIVDVSDDFEGLADILESDTPRYDDGALGPDVLDDDIAFDGSDFNFGGMLDCVGVEVGEGFDVSRAEVETLMREFQVDW